MSLRTSSTGGNLVYKHLVAAGISVLISGDIYRGNRPTNSTKEDIIIRPLAITNASNQKQYIDLLCFVPDVARGQNHMVPDTLRLETLATAIKNVFEDGIYAPAYTITILEMQDENEVPGEAQHYAFFRLYFQIHEPIEL